MRLGDLCPSFLSARSLTLSVVDELFARDVVVSGLSAQHAATTGSSSVKSLVSDLRCAFPNIAFSIEDMRYALTSFPPPP